MLGDVWHCGAFVAYAEAPLRAQIIWARVYTADALLESLAHVRIQRAPACWWCCDAAPERYA